MSLTLPIVIGKKYVRRDGVVVTAQRCGFLGVAAFVNEDPVFGESGGVSIWLSNGCVSNTGKLHKTDLVADFIEPVGHVHAALMALYAEDAARTAEPWLLWQIADDEEVDKWISFIGTGRPGWNEGCEYRRKPVPTTKTVWVNLYRNKTGVFSGYQCTTRADADMEAGHDRLACVQIEVPV